MTTNLVIVESPAKAKTIEKYLGKDYKVLSSVGHIRKDTKVDVDHDFAVTYEIDPDHEKIVKDLKKAAKSAKTVWLATDEDREGESISWHLCEVLDLPKNTKRITFHEITESALKEAIKHPRTVDMDMVKSQQARQTLDMLVGYDLSGVIRTKVPGAISAGRVQSPALKLIVEREREIEKFDKKFYFKVTAEFKPGKGKILEAVLDGDQPKTEAAATKLLEELKQASFKVENVDQKDAKKSAPVPFTTAALQIEANSRLGFSASTTMRAAQALYQSGHITYHRTDSLNLSNQALAAIAGYIEKTYGKDYLEVKKFKTKSASAQEAHEAIRPTHIEKEIAGKTDFEKKLYHLIRTRTLATQMAPAKVLRTTISISHHFVAKGEVVVFDGFLKVYGNKKDLILPKLAIGDPLDPSELLARQTFERPPARYTEGSLVKKLEELGIGRPSTYASIMSAIQARGYVVKGDSDGTPRDIIELSAAKGKKIHRHITTEKTGATKGKLLPTPVGELVAGFLSDHFENIVDYGFTADIEKQLDKIADQKLEKTKMLKTFYNTFSKEVKKATKADRYNNATKLGTDPKTKLPIYAKIGKNGGFIQLGDNEKESGKKPRFAPLPDGATVKTVTYEQALKQLELPELPRLLGTAKDGAKLIASAGPFGPYLKAGKYNVQLKDHDPYTITLKTAEKLYQEKLDSIIADWGDIMIIVGAYGPYVKGPGRRNNRKIDKDIDPKKLTREEAEKILAAPKKNRHAPHRRAKKSAKKSAKRSAKKSAKK